MADAKPEVLLARLLQRIATRFQLLYMFSTSAIPSNSTPTIAGINWRHILEMADARPEIVIYNILEHRNLVPTNKPTFSWSTVLMKPAATLWHSWHWKCKTAANRLVELLLSFRQQQLTRFQRSYTRSARWSLRWTFNRQGSASIDVATQDSILPFRFPEIRQVLILRVYREDPP